MVRYEVVCFYNGVEVRGEPMVYATKARAEAERVRWDRHVEQLRRVMKRDIRYEVRQTEGK